MTFKINEDKRGEVPTDELQSFMEDYMPARTVVIRCGRFGVVPHLSEVYFEDPADGRSISVKTLFNQLGLENRLPEVYARASEDKTTQQNEGYAGLWVQNGQQKLANILSKTVIVMQGKYNPKSAAKTYIPQ